VRHVINVYAQHLTIHIHFRAELAPALISKETLYHGAIQYLSNNGFLKLAHDGELDFVVGVATGKYLRYGDHFYDVVPSSNRIEIEIAGTAVYNVKKSTKFQVPA
jgi:hypothetical protein